MIGRGHGGRTPGERGAADRRYHRKSPEQLVRPEYSALGAPLSEPLRRLAFCPMLKRLREIGAPLFEDMPGRKA